MNKFIGKFINFIQERAFFSLFSSDIQSQLKIVFQTIYYNKFYILFSNMYFSIIKYFEQISYY